MSMAPRKWATGAEEWCTTDVKTDGSKTGGVATLQEWEERALTVRPVPFAYRGWSYRRPFCDRRIRWRNW